MYFFYCTYTWEEPWCCCLLHHCCSILPSLCMLIPAFAPSEFKWEVCRDGSYLHVQTRMYSAQEDYSKVRVSPTVGSHQRAPAAVPVIREQRPAWEAMGWRAEKWQGTIFYFPPDSVAWIPWTRSSKAAVNPSFKCLIYFLCNTKILTVFVAE